MANFLSGILRPFGLDPSQGYDTAAQGARDASTSADALSALQWQRQMQGLGGALGYVQNLQDLYNSIYSPGGGKPAAGGGPPPGAPTASQMSMMSTPSTNPGTSGMPGATVLTDAQKQQKAAEDLRAKTGMKGSGGWRGPA